MSGRTARRRKASLLEEYRSHGHFVGFRWVPDEGFLRRLYDAAAEWAHENEPDRAVPAFDETLEHTSDLGVMACGEVYCDPRVVLWDDEFHGEAVVCLKTNTVLVNADALVHCASMDVSAHDARDGSHVSMPDMLVVTRAGTDILLGQ